MPPIRILGAGLSGMATALLLARAGREVEMYDRRRGAGGRFGGGFQVLENGGRREDAFAELRRLGFDMQCDHVPLRSAVLLDQDMRRYEVASKEPYAYLIRRGEEAGTVDKWLREEVERAGVRIECGGRSPGWTPDVVATGPRRADGVARELVFRTDHPDLIVVLFDPRLTPTGYSYLFVCDGWGTLGAAQVRQVQRLRDNAVAAFDRLRSAFPMTMEPLGPERVNFMNFGVPRHLRHDGTWYVGEAAGVQDFLFGLGNRLSLRSAALVAAALTGKQWEEAVFRRDLVDPMEASVLGRAGYELAGPRLTSLACSHLASGDFRERLIALQRPAWWRRVLARIVMAVWRDRDDSGHLPVARWCRSKEAVKRVS